MLGATKHGLKNLLNFTGRDARQTFWYYVLFIVVLRFIVSTVLSIPLMAGTMSAVFKAANQHADPAAMTAEMMQQMAKTMPIMLWTTLVISAISAVLLIASTVRRLHDSELSGWWAALPAALYAGALSQMPAQMQKAIEMFSSFDGKTPPNPAEMMRGQGTMALLAYVPIIILVILGVRKSTPGPNRFGDSPVSF